MLKNVSHYAIIDYRERQERNKNVGPGLYNKIVHKSTTKKKAGSKMAKGKGGSPAPQKSTSTRTNGKASKKNPKVFDASKRRLVSGK